MCLALITLTSGCTNWKKEHDKLLNINQNLQGELNRERERSGEKGEELAASHQTIEQLRKQIEELNQSPGRATGFGDDVDVAFDAAAGTITVTLPNKILFSSGAAKLKTATSRELNHIESVLETRYLIKRGVPEDQIRAVGCGAARPVVPNTSRTNKAKNRRVEIVVYMR